MSSSTEHLLATIRAIDLATNQRLALVRRKNLGARAEEIALAEADAAKRALRATALTFDNAIPTTIDAARRPEHGNRLIRLRGSPTLEEPYQIELSRDREASLTDLLGQRPDEVDAPSIMALASKICILGEDGGVIETEDFVDRQLVNRFQDLVSTYANWEYLLLVVPTAADGGGPADGRGISLAGPRGVA